MELPESKYRGILYMLIATICISLMSAVAKYLGEQHNAGQLTLYRNSIGLIAICFSFLYQKPNRIGKRYDLLILRGIFGTIALYTFFYCILHMPLGTAMSYNLSSTLFIAVIGLLFLKEYHGPRVLVAVAIGFIGMLCIYKPTMHLPVESHMAGLVSGLCSALAYITIGRLNHYFEARVIVFSFLLFGIFVPLSFIAITQLFDLPETNLFYLTWKWPHSWPAAIALGVFAVLGQFFITKAYSLEKAGIVSAFSYMNIIFSVFLGMLLGDAFPDILSWTGILCIICCGIMVSRYLYKEKADDKVMDNN